MMRKQLACFFCAFLALLVSFTASADEDNFYVYYDSGNFTENAHFHLASSCTTVNEMLWPMKNILIGDTTAQGLDPCPVCFDQNTAAAPWGGNTEASSIPASFCANNTFGKIISPTPSYITSTQAQEIAVAHTQERFGIARNVLLEKAPVVHLVEFREIFPGQTLWVVTTFGDSIDSVRNTYHIDAITGDIIQYNKTPNESPESLLAPIRDALSWSLEDCFLIDRLYATHRVGDWSFSLPQAHHLSEEDATSLALDALINVFALSGAPLSPSEIRFYEKFQVHDGAVDSAYWSISFQHQTSGNVYRAHIAAADGDILLVDWEDTHAPGSHG